MNATPALVRPCFASDLDPLAALWIARLCIGYSSAISQFNDSMYSEELRQMLGLSPREGTFSRVAMRPLIKTRANELEQRKPRRKTVLDRNILMISKLLDLDALQSSILAFAALTRQHPLLCEIADSIHCSSVDAVTRMLSLVLNARDSDIKKAIGPNSQLRVTRIISLEFLDFGRGLKVLVPAGLRGALFSAADNIQMLMSSFLDQAPPSKLTARAFEHLDRETALLTAYLAKATANRTPGVNVLIYGAPGTGKTEYVRWLADHLKVALYQVKALDEDGAAIAGQDRLASYLMSQRFLRHSNALMLFDEMEDLFPNDDGALFVRRPDIGKMFINQMLENNPVPALWVANAVAHMDKAYLRRFDFSFEMGVPPMAVRRDILTGYLHEHAISAAVINELAQHEQLSPAQVEKAAKILKLSGKHVRNRETTLLHVIENSRLLLEQEKSDPVRHFTDGHYRLDYLNPDCDVPHLLGQLKRAPDAAGALCFYGAPGTGKTALAHHIAREMERPLLAKRASDILSPYVGETEQKIARMFRQARHDGAVLLLDEADSFMAERQAARNAWEVTAVNEMLTQMERFDGLFICSTNLMQRLDHASLRRFAFKIRFDYLKPEQRWRLFLAHAQHVREEHEPEYRVALDHLNNLTPGDFATIRRQSALLNLPLTADELLKRLQQESKSKVGTHARPIGFIHPQ